MADETTNTERLQKHTLFPIIASNSGAVGTQTSLLFPCVSVDAQERGSNVKRGEFSSNKVQYYFYIISQLPYQAAIYALSFNFS